MSTTDTKTAIQNILQSFSDAPLADSATSLLSALGYTSDKTLQLESNNATTFLETFVGGKSFNRQKACIDEWRSVDFLFQLTGDEIRNADGQGSILFETSGIYKEARIESYIFLAIELTGESHTRTRLADITREVNRLFAMPAMILFRHGPTLTLSVINRRLHRRDESRDVLEKVTLIKDIRLGNPHRAHVEILHDLSLAQLYQKHRFENFVALHDAWRLTLDSSELNKRFYRELANWYFWALHQVTFPAQKGIDDDINHATNVIRLITRLIFTWFIKEKGLVPEELFNEKVVATLLKDTSPNASTYYKAILQNLFFATLNTEMGSTKQPRKFRGKNSGKGQDQHYGITNVFRYEDSFHDSAAALKLFEQVPFLNGGLFECLDHEEEIKGKTTRVMVDGFSDRKANPINVPNRLFFTNDRWEHPDLNADYGTTGKHYPVRGLLDILHAYKFTINENTPIEEEIALDPELLGRVFENLLASFNPETKTTARKQTGSFYTPREIVDYMVDESLVASLKTKLEAALPDATNTTERFNHLFAYNDQPHQFKPSEVEVLIQAIDHLNVLDPACGSGAFPMGILHKLVFVLGKLDPGNQSWKARQLEKAAEIPDTTVREKVLADIEQTFGTNELNYGRKLYLIENCIYGVDIQPIAVQISKLRFFISLVVDQKLSTEVDNNLGIRPLPNLETKFVAANTLIGIDRPGQQLLRNLLIDAKEAELRQVRERYFIARTPTTKAKYREQDTRLRTDIAKLLKDDGWDTAITHKLAAWNPYDYNASAEFFDMEWMFGIVDGFDLTIGNPPYVRADEQSVENKRLRELIRASGQYETLWEKWDLFIPFIERGFKLLRDGGITTMIVSDAYCHSKYAQKSQTWFLKNSRIRRLDFCSDLKIFDAAVHNVIYFFQRGDGSHDTPERRIHRETFGNVTMLPSDEQTKLTARIFFPEDRVVSAFACPIIELSTACYISVGMVVHADEKVAKGAFELENLVANSRDATHPRRFVEGKHLERWWVATSKWLEWGTERAPDLFRRPTFPELYEVPEKILIHRTAGEGLRSCYDVEQTLCNHTVMICLPWHALEGVRNKSLKNVTRYRGEKPPRPDLPKREELEATSRRFAMKYLLGVMNSAPARDFLRANRRSNTDLYPEDWKKLPIPDVPSDQQRPIVAIVDQILTAKRDNPNADISNLEADLDMRVRLLYGLKPEGIRIGKESSSSRSSAKRATVPESDKDITEPASVSTKRKRAGHTKQGSTNEAETPESFL